MRTCVHLTVAVAIAAVCWLGPASSASAQPYADPGTSDKSHGELFQTGNSNKLPDRAQSAAESAERYHVAEAERQLAQFDLVQTRRQIEGILNNSPEHRAAVRALNQARDAYETARKKIIAGLEKDPQFIALRKASRDLARQIAATTQPATGLLGELALRKMQIDDQIEAYIDRAMAAAGLDKLRADVTAARVALDKQVATEQSFLRTHPALREANDRLAKASAAAEKARIDAVAANAGYQEALAQQNREDYLRDRYSYLYGRSYYYSPYGYGYGYGFGYRPLVVVGLPPLNTPFQQNVITYPPGFFLR